MNGRRKKLCQINFAIVFICLRFVFLFCLNVLFQMFLYVFFYFFIFRFFAVVLIEILALDGFCEEQQQQELGILVVGWQFSYTNFHI